MIDTASEGKFAHPKLLEKIDKLFELNIGELVDLPQLLVVGDQSSGKSSVLEGLTGLPFPRDSGLCTRFATHITFRRTAEKRISIYIVPDEEPDEELAEELKAWRKDDLQNLGREDFVQIFKEVNTLMGIVEPGEGTESGKNVFSDDILRLEICGPDRDHLSVIDVPGIFRGTTEGTTTDEDIDMVRKMATRFMENPRAVILAVNPANVDLATQEILDMAAKCDPDKQRTLGIMTKPDLVDRGSEKDKIKVLEGKSHRLKLGWCVVRNPGQQELNNPTLDRHAAEKAFFNTQEPWRKLPKDRVGIKALQSRLGEILGEMIQREFLKVKHEITQTLRGYKSDLDSLGPSRDTQDDQRSFLLDLAIKFQDIASPALRAQYAGHNFFENSGSFRLATAVVNRNSEFARDMWRRGQTMSFKDDKERKSNASGEDLSTSSKTRRNKRKFEELDDVLQEDCEVHEPSPTSIMEWLKDVYLTSRGFELGTFQASLLDIIWQKQSANWNALAFSYISDIIVIVHTFIVELLGYICKEERAKREIISILIERLAERYKRGIGQTRFLLHVERNDTLFTTNHHFAESLEKNRQERIRTQLDQMSTHSPHHGGRVVRVDVTLPTTTASNLEHTICDLHDILKSYYRVARQRFVDTVCMQAANHYLVTGPDAPIKVFSPKLVNQLTVEQLEAIAGEEASTRRKRAHLKRDIENLEKAKKVLNS